jgi:GNAT superfamily N-acetyltransferase
MMARVEPGIPQAPSVFASCELVKAIEPKLRAVHLRRTFLTTEMLALRDPQLNPMIKRVADGYAVFHGRDAMSSFAREVGTSRPVTENELSALEQFYRDHACPVRVWVSDRTHNSFLDVLQDRGYAARSHSVSWFRSLDRGPIHCEHRNVEVLPVASHRDERWIQTVAAGFFEDDESVSPTEIPSSFVDLFFALGCAPGDQRFLALKDGEYVGGAVLNVADDVAMVRTASTRFARRNMGVQQALLATRLKCAREQGARIALVQTPPSGPAAHNMTKFGFEPFGYGCIMELL